MKTSMGTVGAVLVLLQLWACEDRGGSGLLAHAEGHELATSQAVELLAGEQLPNQPDVARTLAELWVDYTLLAEAAREDSTFADIDVDPLVRQQLEQEVILAFRDSVVDADTTVSDEELERRFAQEAPGVRVRARHILLTHPDQATQPQRDSVRQVAESLRRRIQAGESFEDLAREHSQDPGSAPSGGDLGFFDRQDMVRPFSDAAFALEPGELSDVVETPYGLHVIRVEEKEIPSLEELRPQFRQRVQQERLIAAESTFIAGVEEGADLEMVEGAPDLVRQLAAEPATRLSGRARSRALVRYRGGEFALGELQDFLQTRAPQFRAQLGGATDEVIEANFLKGLTQRELLLRAAEERGLEVSEARADSMGQQLRERFREAAHQLELVSLQPDSGESRDQAISRKVLDLLRGMLKGERDVVPLGAFSFLLRKEHRWQIYGDGVDRVVERVAEIRGPSAPPGAPPQERPGEPGIDTARPDTQPAPGAPGQPGGASGAGR